MLVGETEALPPAAFVPVHPPDAVQEVAFVLDQDSVELPPAVIVAGLTETETVAAGVGVGVGVGVEEGGAGSTTVIDVAWHAVVPAAASAAQTVKSYCPGTLAVPVRSPLGLTIMPSGGVPDSSTPD